MQQKALSSPPRHRAVRAKQCRCCRVLLQFVNESQFRDAVFEISVHDE